MFPRPSFPIKVTKARLDLCEGFPLLLSRSNLDLQRVISYATYFKAFPMSSSLVKQPICMSLLLVLRDVRLLPASFHLPSASLLFSSAGCCWSYFPFLRSDAELQDVAGTDRPSR